MPSMAVHCQQSLYPLKPSSLYPLILLHLGEQLPVVRFARLLGKKAWRSAFKLGQ